MVQPEVARPPFGVLDDRCPRLAVIMHNRAHGWQGAPEQIVHTSAQVGMYDTAEAMKWKPYHQCLTILPRILSCTSALPSRQLVAYYKLLLRGVHVEAGLANKEYMVLLNRHKRGRGEELEPIPLEDVPEGNNDCIIFRHARRPVKRQILDPLLLNGLLAAQSDLEAAVIPSRYLRHQHPGWPCPRSRPTLEEVPLQTASLARRRLPLQMALLLGPGRAVPLARRGFRPNGLPDWTAALWLLGTTSTPSPESSTRIGSFAVRGTRAREDRALKQRGNYRGLSRLVVPSGPWLCYTRGCPWTAIQAARTTLSLRTCQQLLHMRTHRGPSWRR